MFLKSFEVLEVNDLRSLDNILRSVASGRLAKGRKLESRSTLRFSNVSGVDISLFYINSGFSSSFAFEPVDYTRLVFQIEGPCRLKIGSQKIDIDAGHPGYVMPAGYAASEEHPEGFQSIAMRLSSGSLRRRLSCLIGEAIDKEIEFSPPKQGDFAISEYIKRNTLQLSQEIDLIPKIFAQSFFKEWESITLTRLLFHFKHNYSAHLCKPIVKAEASRVAIVEEFINENWNQLVTIEDLASRAGVSGRTLVRDFIEKHDLTPTQYMRRIRLQRAHLMLQSHDSPSVMAVALKCGFSSFGHFAAAYRKMFGELPSERKRRG